MSDAKTFAAPSDTSLWDAIALENFRRESGSAFKALNDSVAARERDAAAQALAAVAHKLRGLIATKGEDDDLLTYDEVIEQAARVVEHEAAAIGTARDATADQRLADERRRCIAIVRQYENTDPERAFDAIVEAIEAGR